MVAAILSGDYRRRVRPRPSPGFPHSRAPGTADPYRPDKDRLLHPLDVDLEQVAPRLVEAIEGTTGTRLLFAVRPPDRGRRSCSTPWPPSLDRARPQLPPSASTACGEIALFLVTLRGPWDSAWRSSAAARRPAPARGTDLPGEEEGVLPPAGRDPRSPGLTTLRNSSISLENSAVCWVERAVNVCIVDVVDQFPAGTPSGNCNGLHGVLVVD